MRRLPPFLRLGWKLLLVAAGSAALAGCVTVKLASDYDEQIDSGATQVLADTTTFVNKMTPLAGSPAGEYDANKDFYAAEEGKISALEARAVAHEVLNTCPSTTLVAKTVSGVGSTLSNNAPAKAAFDQYAATIKNDECEVVVLQQLYQEMEDLKGFHQAQGAKGIPPEAVGPILVGGIGATVEIIIAVEAAKKADQSGARQVALDFNALVGAMTHAGQGLAGNVWTQIQTVAVPELQKIATQIVAIETHLNAYTPAGAQYLFDMQVRASIAVIAGMTALTLIDVQQAINQILAAVKQLVNGAIGFALVA